MGNFLMASSSLSSTLSCNLRSVPKLPTPTSSVPSSLFRFNPMVHNGIGISTRIHAKFEEFQGQENLQDDKILESGFDPDAENTESMEDEEDDRWVFNLGLLYLESSYISVVSKFYLFREVLKGREKVGLDFSYVVLHLFTDFS